MAEAVLFKDWKKFITLLPEESIVYTYKDVNSLCHSYEIKQARSGVLTCRHGDLVLTNKRLFYLEYEYEKVSLTLKMKLMRILAISIIIIAVIAAIASLTIILIPLTLPILLLSLFLLSRISKRLPELSPIGYSKMSLEIPLERIVDTKWDDELKNFLEIRVMQRREPTLIGFYEASKTNEFRKNLSYLIYEAQHRPKEIVQYNIVTKFNLNEDGTISIKCPYCGSSAPLQTKESEVACKYCGKRYIIPKKILELIG